MVDASYTLALGVLNEQSEEAELLLEEAMMARVRLIVPPHWRLEMLNGILQGFRQRKLAARSFDEALALVNLHIDTELVEHAPSEEILALAKRHGLTAYDAAYLAAALREQALLATADRELATAAREHGVLWEPAP